MNRGRVIDVMGGTGGVGASTLAAALAQRCQLRQARPLTLCVAVLTAGADFGAADDRVPGRVGPFDLRFSAHDRTSTSI